MLGCARVDDTWAAKSVDCEAIVETLALVLLPLPSEVRGRVEEVVVDTAARGQGVTAVLTQEALRITRGAGARTVDLTSQPDRAAANRPAL
ncbi:GNAT family N-acetyltransferase [Streptomyces sp. NPDC058683]|uniref:GNAT family N-acetyltransferase n=1 Tax=Streptomyces sp. NPDC058683 TaxID=3346597 RepID=UPI00366377F5